MEKQQDNTLMKARSHRNVLATAFRTYTGSFWKLVRATWIPAVVTAAVSTALVMMVCMELYFFVPLAIVAVLLELITWLFAAQWLAGRPVVRLFRPALRHWLLLPLTIVGISVLLIPLTLMVAMPLLVLTFAQVESQSGALTGDPTGMPSYIPWLTGAVSMGTSLLLVYIHLFSAFVAYYAWGSAETRQQERQKLNIS